MLVAKYEKGAVVEGTVVGQDIIFGSNCVVKGEIHLGNKVVIGSLALVEGKNITIGSETRIMPFAAIGSNTRIGKNCFIGPYFSMANAKHPGPNAKLEELIIGDNVIIGTHTLIWPGIRIGDNVKINMGSEVHADVPDGTHIRGQWPEVCKCK